MSPEKSFKNFIASFPGVHGSAAAGHDSLLRKLEKILPPICSVENFGRNGKSFFTDQVPPEPCYPISLTGILPYLMGVME
jgi:hypothetical protein